jgi:hypothetical protein
MQSLLNSKASLVQCVNSQEWKQLAGKSSDVYAIVTNEEDFWAPLQLTIKFLQPFSDLIHQIEADKPALGKCYAAIKLLDEHVAAFARTLSADDSAVLLRTWNRRRDNSGTQSQNNVASVLQPAHIVAYLLDPIFAIDDAGDMVAPQVGVSRETLATELVKRVGGEKAATQFTHFLLSGWPKEVKGIVAECTKLSGDQDRQKHASVRMRKGVWKRYLSEQMPELAAVAVRMMSVHPTSCSTERNWGAWGRMYTAARNKLGLERAKKMITFCFNHRMMNVDTDDFVLNLSMLEGNEDV